MKLYLRYFDLDVDHEENPEPDLEGMVYLNKEQNSNTLSLHNDTINLRIVLDLASMCINSGWQPSDCMVFWGYIPLGSYLNNVGSPDYNRYKQVKIELYRKEPKQKEANNG